MQTKELSFKKSFCGTRSEHGFEKQDKAEGLRMEESDQQCFQVAPCFVNQVVEAGYPRKEALL